MQDVLQYDGKRVIVTGAASGMGAATAQILVDLGAEVHAIDIKKPEVTGLASFSQCDLREPGADRRDGRARSARSSTRCSTARACRTRSPTST